MSKNNTGTSDKVHRRRLGRAAVLISVACLAGCGGGTGGRSIVEGTPMPLATDAKVSSSQVIFDLQSRRSILPISSPAGRMASATLASNTGPGAAELRLAKIKSDVESKNWLPTLGTNISLASLGSLAGSLIVDVALFDNGRKRAEREFAVADVEVAAVNLSLEANDRVLQSLTLYTDMQRAEMEARIARLAIIKLEDYSNKARQRVSRGYSNVTEQTEVDQALSEMRMLLGDAEQQASKARSELAQMGVGQAPETEGRLLSVPSSFTAQTLDVALAQAKANRTMASARIDRAGRLPGLGASASASTSGSTSTSAAVTGSDMGYGTSATVTMLSASQDVARQSVTHAQGEASRRIGALKGEISRLQARHNGYRPRVLQAREAYELYVDQFALGTQQLTDLVDAFTAMINIELEYARIGYDIDQANLELAHAYGALADGSRI